MTKRAAWTISETLWALCLVMVGVVQAQDAAVVWEGQPSESAQLSDEARDVLGLGDDALARRLAEVQVELSTRRQHDRALVLFEALRVRAAREGTVDIELLTELAVARANLLADLGRPAEALQATRHLLPELHELQALLRLTATRALSADEQRRLDQALLDPRLVQLRSRLGEEDHAGSAAHDALAAWAQDGYGISDEALRYVVATFGSPTEEMTDVVFASLRKRDEAWIREQFQAYALPSLALLSMRGGGDQPPLYGSDPIAVMLTIDEPRTLDFIDDRFALGGPRWRSRLGTVLLGPGSPGNADLSSAALWSLGQGEVQVGQCLRPRRLELLARLIADPDCRAAALRAVRVVAQWGGLTHGISEELVRILRQEAAPSALAVLEVLATGYRLHAAIPVYEAGLSHADSSVRRACAERLADFGPHPSLLDHQRDADPGVRVAVARSLQRRSVEMLFGNEGNPNSTSRRLDVPLSEQALEVADQLLADPLEEVQHQLIDVLASRGDALPSRLYRIGLDSSFESIRVQVVEQLGVARGLTYGECEVLLEQVLSDSSARVRLAALGAGAELGVLPPHLQQMLLTRLAGDPDERVLKELDAYLMDWMGYSPLALWDALVLRMQHATRPFQPRSGSAEDWSRWFDDSVRGTAAELSHGLRLGLDHELPTIVTGMMGKLQWGDMSRQAEVLRQELDPAQLAALYRWSRLHADPNVRLLLDETLNDGGPSVREMFRQLLRDERTDSTGRLLAVARLDELLWESGAAQLVQAALRGVDPAGALLDKEYGAPRSAAPDRNAFLLAVLADQQIDEQIQRWLTSHLADLDGPDGDALARVVLERWLSQPEVCVRAAVAHLGSGFAGAETAAWLTAAVERGHGSLTSAIVEAIRELQDPALIPLLGRLLTTVDNPSETGRVIAALLTYGPAARDALRGGLLAITYPPSLETLQRALQSLDQFEALGAAGGRLATREQAGQRLLVMLGHASPVQRAEAARGLASLGTLEAIPALIPLLEDDEASVREAAREALDRLHARSEQREE